MMFSFAGNDQAVFRDILDKLAHGGFKKEEHWDILNTRNYNNLTEEEKNDFEQNAVMLSATNAALVPYNKRRLRQLDVPIAVISAINKPLSIAKAATPNRAYGLLNNIMLCKGSKVCVENT